MTQQLEVRALLAATNPLPLDWLDGANGFELLGNGGHAGSSVSSAGDINGDGFDDIIVGAPRLQIDGNGAGAAFVVFGMAGGFDASVDLTALNGNDGFRIDGVNWFDYFGRSVGSAGDLNGDGFDDLVIGAYEFTFDHDDREPHAGEAYVIFGRQSFAATFDVTTLSGSNGFRMEGENVRDFFGWSVNTAGDVNADGYADIIVSAPRATGSGSRGDTFVVFGKSGGFSSVMNMSSLNGTNGFEITGKTSADFAGESVSSAGDINGDGYDDLLVGARNSDPTGEQNHDHGQTFVIFGHDTPFAPAIGLADIDGTNGFRINGVDIGDLSGESVSSAGDVNGDGIDDVIIGASRAEPGANTGTGEGESYVVFGRTSGFGADLDLSSLNGSDGFRISGKDSSDALGAAVSGAGDVNGDGYDDLIVGARRAEADGEDDGIHSGETYIVFGKAAPFVADMNVSTLDGKNGFRVDGVVAGTQTGYVVGGAGDINGDGFDDVVLGTNGSQESYAVFGGNFTGGADTQTGGDGNDTLTATRGANGVDILVGGRGSDILNSDGGPDVLRGGQGDDTLSIPDADFSSTRRVLGGNGTDTLQLTGTGVDFNLTTIADNRIVDIEVIDIINSGSTLTLNAQEVLNISSHSNTLTILHAGTDTVNRGSGWIQQASEVADGRTFEVFTQGAATLRIHTVPTITLNVSAVAVTEDSAAELVYTLTRDVTTGPLTVDFAVNGSATFSDDYTQSGAFTFSTQTGSVSFADGQATAAVTVTPVSDDLVEQHETVDLTLTEDSARFYLVGSPGAASATITDDDTATFSINDVTANEGAGTLDFTVSTSNPIDTAVQVQVSFTDGTATGSNSDYSSATRTVMFAADDQTSKLVSVPIINDSLAELNETFIAALTTNTALGSRSTDFSDGGTATITDNDTTVFTIDDIMVAEDVGTATFTVSVNNPIDIPVSLDVAYVDGTAIGASGGTGAHYDDDADQVTFSAGSTTSQQVSVAITDDNIITGDRDFLAILKLVTDVSTRRTDFTDTGVGFIIDDTATFTVDDVMIDEDSGAATLTISLDKPLDIPVDVSVSYADVTATGSADGTSADFSNVTDTVTFPAGTSAAKLTTVTITNDDIAEGNHDFTARLSTATSLGNRSADLTDTATITILDDEIAGFVVSETNGATATTESGSDDHLNIALTARPESDVVLSVESQNVTEVTASPAVLIFTSHNWDRPQTVTVTGVDDATVDGDRTTEISVTVTADSSADAFDNLPQQSVSVLNSDNDVAGFTISRATAEVSETGTEQTFTAVLNSRPLTDVVLDVNTNDAGESRPDFASLLFTAENWNVAQTVKITGIDDVAVDGIQTSTITIAVDSNSSDPAFASLGDQAVIVTTLDDDVPAFSLSRTAVTVAESGSAETLTIVLDRAPLGEVTFSISSDDIEEATVTPATVSFSAATWNRPQVVTITGADDVAIDGTRTSEVTISVNQLNSDDAFDGLSDQIVTVTTTDDDVGVIGPLGTSNDVRPTLAWTPIGESRTYEVWLEQLGGSSNPIINPTVLGTSFTVPNDLGIGRYRTWVRGNLPNGSKSAWVTGDFQISLPATLHNLPFHGTDRTPSIAWDAVPGATAYRVYIGNSTAGGAAVIDEVVSATSFTPATEFSFGRHQIWVRAIGTGNYPSSWSEVVRYYIGPELLTPTRSTFDASPTFTWTTLPDVASYQLYVAKGNAVVINQSGLAETSFRHSTTLDDGNYRWWIRPTHTSGKGGAWSGRGEFSVGGSPKILGPGGEIADSTPTINWQPVDGAGSYEIYLFNDDGGGLVHREAGLTETSFASFPLPDGSYRVWIKSYKENGDAGQWSRAQHFVVSAATINTAVTPVSPVNPTFDTTPEFRWGADAGAESFDLYLTNGTTVMTPVGIVGTVWTPSTPLTAGSWQWWVRAQNSSGHYGPWSAPAATDVGGRAMVLAPTGTTSDRTPTISWTPVIGASRYVFQLDNLTTGQTATIRENQIADSHFTPTTALGSGEYRAWVRAINGETNAPGPWSLKLDFRISANRSDAQPVELTVVFVSLPDVLRPEIVKNGCRTEASQQIVQPQRDRPDDPVDRVMKEFADSEFESSISLKHDTDFAATGSTGGEDH